MNKVVLGKGIKNTLDLRNSQMQTNRLTIKDTLIARPSSAYPASKYLYNFYFYL